MFLSARNNRHVNAIDVDFETKEIYGWMLDSDQIADNRHLEISQNAAPRLTQDFAVDVIPIRPEPNPSFFLR